MASLDVPAPMAGSIKEVLVAAGDRVAEGQEIIVLESMKMEIPVESPATGTVSEVLIAPLRPHRRRPAPPADRGGVGPVPIPLPCPLTKISLR